LPTYDKEVWSELEFGVLKVIKDLTMLLTLSTLGTLVTLGTSLLRK